MRLQDETTRSRGLRPFDARGRVPGSLDGAAQRREDCFSAKRRTVVTLPKHYELSADVGSSAEAVFAYLDDQRNLSAHMGQSSWMMAGSRMTLEFDAKLGREAGSKMTLRGTVLGVPLSVDEVVVERTPPFRKTWETTGAPKLLVLGAYRMGFDIATTRDVSRLRVFIDYTRPEPPWRLLGQLFGDAYARWCVKTMVGDAVKHFGAGRA